MAIAVVGLGSNLGSREALIRTAVGLLEARRSIAVRDFSSLYQTEPLGPPQGMFLNAAVRIDTDLTPQHLLSTLLRIERRLGRLRSEGARWGPRPIDLDLLWMDGVNLETESLTVPHPQLTERLFALQPLLDVAPELGATYAQRLAFLGSPLSSWAGSALSLDQTEASVEADSVPDALCLAASRAFGGGLPKRCGVSRCRATRRTVTDATPGCFAEALSDALRSGFALAYVTITHCSESQWAVFLHGEPDFPAVAPSIRVSVEVRPGVERAHRAIVRFH